MSKAQTDNTSLALKVNLRMRFLEAGREYNVVDAFSGHGQIWRGIQKNLPDTKFNVLRIDKKEDSGADLTGDNVKFLGALDLNKFDIVDLDAYGVPYRQLEEVFKQKARLKIFVTFIQSMFGALPHGMLGQIGYSRGMIQKCPSVFNKNGFDKFKKYLAKRGIRNIKYVSLQNKYYIYIDTYDVYCD